MAGNKQLVYVGGYDGAIHTVAFDPTASPPTLDIVATSCEAGYAPTWLVLSDDGRNLYAVDEWGKGRMDTPTPGRLTSFAVEDGSLTLSSTIPSGGVWPCHATLDPLQSSLITVHYKSGTVTATPILPSGALDSNSDHQIVIANFSKAAFTQGPHPSRQGQPYPHGVDTDPSRKVIVVADLGADKLRLLKPSPSDAAKWAPIDEVISLRPGDGPRHVVFATSRDGSRTLAYVMNELDNSISVYSYPSFTPLQTNLSILPPQPAESLSNADYFQSWHSAEILVSLDGKALYGTNRMDDHDPLDLTRPTEPQDQITTFTLLPDGTIDTSVAPTYTPTGRAPRHISLSREGKGEWIAAAAHDSDELIIFDGSDSTALKEVARMRGVGRPGMVLWA